MLNGQYDVLKLNWVFNIEIGKWWFKILQKLFQYLGAFDVVEYIIRKTLLILTQSGLKKHVCIDTKTYRVQQTISSKFVLRRGEERKERKEEDEV